MLTLAVAQSTNPSQFGAFSVAYLAYFLGLGLTRGLALEPLLVIVDVSSVPSIRQRHRQVAGAAIVMASIGSVVLGPVGGVTGGRIGGPLALVAVCLPALYLQDASRYILFSQRRPAAAAANDFLWCVIQLIGFVFLRHQHHAGVTAYLIVWGFSAAVCAVIGSLQSRVLPNCRASLEWLRSRRSLGLPFAAEFLVYSGAGYLALLLITGVAGLGGMGAFRALLTLFGPPQVLVAGLSMAALAEGTGVAGRSRKNFRRLLVWYSVACGSIGLFWGVMLATLPASIGTQLIGDTWVPARNLLLPTTFFVTLWNATAAPAAGLKVLHAARRGLRARGLVCLLLLVLALVGALIGGVSMAVAGFAASQVVGLAVWWHQFGVAFKEDGATHGSDDPEPSLGSLLQGPAE